LECFFRNLLERLRKDLKIFQGRCFAVCEKPHAHQAVDFGVGGVPSALSSLNLFDAAAVEFVAAGSGSSNRTAFAAGSLLHR